MSRDNYCGAEEDGDFEKREYDGLRLLDIMTLVESDDFANKVLTVSGRLGP